MQKIAARQNRASIHHNTHTICLHPRHDIFYIVLYIIFVEIMIAYNFRILDILIKARLKGEHVDSMPTRLKTHIELEGHIIGY